MHKTQNQVALPVEMVPLGTMAELMRDASRYRRLQVLGCAVMNTPQLAVGTVSRFSNLDKIIDEDIRLNPSRGEA